MFGSRSNWHRVKLAHRVTAMGVLVCYAFGQGIIPLPVVPSTKSGAPFPCQQHACGCASAEQCWKSCCCFTKEQKIAWAAANHVEVPYHFMGDNPELARGSAKNGAKHGGCCSSKSESICGPTGKAKHSCCSHTSDSKKKLNAKPPSDEVGTASITNLLACRGLQLFWVTCPPSLPPAPEEYQWLLSRSFDICRSSNDVLVSVSPTPPIPPPRLG